ncbi:hypothetical protein NLB25_27730, partial [Klebsiella pneumoniae]|nr:hypothetical protein [Klebsiella pneumoniae]
WLQAQLPQLSVITANIQPVHMAIMEVSRRSYFTEQQALGEVFNGVPLATGTAAAAQRDHGEYPAGAYGNHGSEQEILLH